MKKIPVGQNQFALVDDNIFDLLNQWGWGLDKSKKNYVIRLDKKYSSHIRMHRFIMGAKFGQEVDHIDGNPLNNQFSNLRFCTHKQNCYGRKLNKDNTSGYKGVVKHEDAWRAQARIDGKLKYFGIYQTKEEAALAYNTAAKKYFGKFARLNTI